MMNSTGSKTGNSAPNLGDIIENFTMDIYSEEKASSKTFRFVDILPKKRGPRPPTILKTVSKRLITGSNLKTWFLLGRYGYWIISDYYFFQMLVTKFNNVEVKLTKECCRVETLQREEIQSKRADVYQV